MKLTREMLDIKPKEGGKIVIPVLFLIKKTTDVLMEI